MFYGALHKTLTLQDLRELALFAPHLPPYFKERRVGQLDDLAYRSDRGKRSSDVSKCLHDVNHRVAALIDGDFAE
jgi:hypothetical protein